MKSNDEIASIKKKREKGGADVSRKYDVTVTETLTHLSGKKGGKRGLTKKTKRRKDIPINSTNPLSTKRRTQRNNGERGGGEKKKRGKSGCASPPPRRKKVGRRRKEKKRKKEKKKGGPDGYLYKITCGREGKEVGKERERKERQCFAGRRKNFQGTSAVREKRKRKKG